MTLSASPLCFGCTCSHFQILEFLTCVCVNARAYHICSKSQSPQWNMLHIPMQVVVCSSLSKYVYIIVFIHISCFRIWAKILNYKPGKMLKVALSCFFLPLFAQGCHYCRTNSGSVQGSLCSRIRPFTMRAYCTKEFHSSVLVCWKKHTQDVIACIIIALHHSYESGCEEHWSYDSYCTWNEIMDDELASEMHTHTFFACTS